MWCLHNFPFLCISRKLSYCVNSLGCVSGMTYIDEVNGQKIDDDSQLFPTLLLHYVPYYGRLKYHIRLSSRNYFGCSVWRFCDILNWHNVVGSDYSIRLYFNVLDTVSLGNVRSSTRFQVAFLILSTITLVLIDICTLYSIITKHLYWNTLTYFPVYEVTSLFRWQRSRVDVTPFHSVYGII